MSWQVWKIISIDKVSKHQFESLSYLLNFHSRLWDLKNYSCRNYSGMRMFLYSKHFLFFYQKLPKKVLVRWFMSIIMLSTISPPKSASPIQKYCFTYAENAPIWTNKMFLKYRDSICLLIIVLSDKSSANICPSG